MRTATQQIVNKAWNFAHVLRASANPTAEPFAGKLVPQDPHEEPAHVLLERIRAAREKAAVAARASRPNNQSRPKRSAKSAK